MTLADRLRAHAAARPEASAFTFLPDGLPGSAVDLTFADIDRRARGVAAHLLERGAGGRAVLLLCSDGPEFACAFAGCLYAGAVAVPVGWPERGPGRIESLAALSGAALALACRDELGAVERTFAASDRLRTLDVVATEGLADPLAVPPPVAPDALAFLLSTSGSTGTAKLVAVTHANALAQCAFLSDGFGYDPRSVHVGWPPVSNTGGFVFTICNPLCTGFRSVRLPIAAFLGHPYRWLAAISHYRGTHGHGPNFAYDLCASQITAEERATLDLGSWEHAINGAEPIRPATLDRFARTFAPCGFRYAAFSLSYGLSEATMQVARSAEPDGPSFYEVDARILQSTGRATRSDGSGPVRRLPLYRGDGELHRRIAIVDPETLRERLPGEEGEICVAGDDVARGYLHEPAETAATFGLVLADGRGPFLRTGDLGFVVDGRLCVSGRLKEIVIIRGANHAPVDLEAAVDEEGAPATRTAAFSVVARGEERLVLVVEAAADDPKAVVKRARAAVAREHHLHAWAVVVVPPGAIPRTANGKIRRNACRDAYLAGALPVIHAATPGAGELARPGVVIEDGDDG